jgi:NADPH:quinone reductase-like Zn-dependent oxidoreductase
VKAIVVHEYGGPEVLKYEDYPDPTPGPGQVLVRVAAAGVNPVDLFQRAGGTREYLPINFPEPIGWDLAGTVVGLGAGVEDFKAGDKVIGWAFATYAELCAVDARLLARAPQSLPLADAAALPLAAMTGAQLVLNGAQVRAGQIVLVSGALGGVGRAAVFAAQDQGARVILGVRGARLEDARQLGADEVLALDDDEAFKALPQVDVVANTVGGAAATQLLAKVKPGGVFASTTGAPDKAADYPDVRVVAFVSKQDSANLRYVVEGVDRGRLSLPVALRLPLKDAAEAHRTLEKGGSGRIVLTVS